MPNVWEQLGITDQTVDECRKMSHSDASEKKRKFWAFRASLLLNIKDKPRSELSTPQINEARDAVRELKNKAMS